VSTRCTVESLAAQPRVPFEGLPGQSRGDLVGAWGDNLERRFGTATLGRVQARLPSSIPTRSSEKDWLPAWGQIAITEAIADECLGGDLARLPPFILEDTRLGLGRLRVIAMKALGPLRLLATTTKAVSDVYDRGRAELVQHRQRGEVGARHIELTGHPLFGHPTWRLLQLAATQTLIELAGGKQRVHGEDAGPEAFTCVIT
jgi:hypothetical protein